MQITTSNLTFAPSLMCELYGHHLTGTLHALLGREGTKTVQMFAMLYRGKDMTATQLIKDHITEASGSSRRCLLRCTVENIGALQA